MKTKLKTISKTVLYGLIMTLFSCQDDSLTYDQSANQSIQITKAKEWFENYKAQQNFHPAFAHVQFRWQFASEITLEDGSFAIGVPIKDIPENPAYTGQKMMFLYPDEKNYIAVVHELLPESNTVSNDYNVKPQFEDLGYYSGYIVTWDLLYGFVKGAKFENGIYVNDVQAWIISTDGKVVVPNSTTGKVAPAIELDEVVVIGGSAPSNPIAIKNDFSIAGAASGATGSGTGGYINSPGTGGGKTSGNTIPRKYINIIDLLTGKAQCLNSLLSEEGNDYVQKLLTQFKGDSEFNVKIISVDKVFTTLSDGTKLEINGSTTPPNGKNIIIQISTSRANSNSALETARVILHEYIHADMFSKLNTESYKDNKEVLDFNKTYLAYEKEQHAAMAKLYLTSMKKALKEFHKNALPQDYNKYIQYYGEAPSDAFYEAFAWGGLQSANVKPWNDLPNARKEEIKKLAARAAGFSKNVPCF